MNKEINLTIINKGLDNVESNGSLYHYSNNIGNALTSPNISDPYMNIKDYEIEEIKLCKLSDYIEFLKSKNVALIKLDIEGYEGKAIESGIDLIIKYHIPFIFMEWTPYLLRSKGTDPKAFFDMFERNGYKISTKDFLSKQYISSEQIANGKQLNVYIIYSSFLD